MAKFKVLYTDTGLKDVEIERHVLEEVGAEMIMGTGTDEDTLIREGADCDGIFITNCPSGRSPRTKRFTNTAK